MKATIINWHGLCRQRFPAPLSAAVVYGSRNDHENATALCEFLIGQLAEAPDITVTWWRSVCGRTSSRLHAIPQGSEACPLVSRPA